MLARLEPRSVILLFYNWFHHILHLFINVVVILSLLSDFKHSGDTVAHLFPCLASCDYFAQIMGFPNESVAAPGMDASKATLLRSSWTRFAITKRVLLMHRPGFDRMSHGQAALISSDVEIAAIVKGLALAVPTEVHPMTLQGPTILLSPSMALFRRSGPPLVPLT